MRILFVGDVVGRAGRAAIAEQRRTPRAGLLGALLTAEVDGDRLTDEEIVANVIVTMVGGLLADLVAANRILLAEIRSRLLAAELDRSDEKPPDRTPDGPG